MAKKQATESKNEQAPIKVLVFEDWISSLKRVPTFAEWYNWRKSYNDQNNLGFPTMKQWYAAFSQLRDQTKPCHPDWFGFGTPVEYNKLCDDSLESPAQEYERLYKELKTIETKEDK